MPKLMLKTRGQPKLRKSCKNLRLQPILTITAQKKRSRGRAKLLRATGMPIGDERAAVVITHEASSSSHENLFVDSANVIDSMNIVQDKKVVGGGEKRSL
jgi:hypothetical protein